MSLFLNKVLFNETYLNEYIVSMNITIYIKAEHNFISDSCLIIKITF